MIFEHVRFEKKWKSKKRNLFRSFCEIDFFNRKFFIVYLFNKYAFFKIRKMFLWNVYLRELFEFASVYILMNYIDASNLLKRSLWNLFSLLNIMSLMLSIWFSSYFMWCAKIFFFVFVWLNWIWVQICNVSKLLIIFNFNLNSCVFIVFNLLRIFMWKLLICCLIVKSFFIASSMFLKKWSMYVKKWNSSINEKRLSFNVRIFMFVVDCIQSISEKSELTNDIQ